MTVFTGLSAHGAPWLHRIDNSVNTEIYERVPDARTEEVGHEDTEDSCFLAISCR